MLTRLKYYSKFFPVCKEGKHKIILPFFDPPSVRNFF